MYKDDEKCPWDDRLSMQGTDSEGDGQQKVCLCLTSRKRETFVPQELTD